MTLDKHNLIMPGAIYGFDFVLIDVVSAQWHNQTRASQGIAQASSYTALPSALRPIKSREITNTYSSRMIAFPVKLQLRHASFPEVALRDYPGDFP